jgi:hypothetical protein
LSPVARRCLRLALGVGIAAAIAWGKGLPFAYLVVILSATLLVVPNPPPGPKQALILIVLMVVMCGWGLLLGPVLAGVPLAGVLILLLGIGVASALTTRPAVAIVGTLMILGNTIIAVIGQQSSAAGLILLQLMVLATVLAVIIAHVAHALLPETEPPPPRPAATTADAAWIGLRSALIMLPPLLMALNNPGTYIMLLMKGAQLSQQVQATDTRVMARELVLSTVTGGALAMAIWWVLGMWPALPLLVLLLMLATLLLARPMYGAVMSKHRFSHWQNALVTMIIILGPAVEDGANATDIGRQMLTRIAMFIGLSLYAATMVALLDTARARRLVAR